MGVATSQRSRNRVRAQPNFTSRFKLIWVVQTEREK
jgi:hypothetical protein